MEYYVYKSCLFFENVELKNRPDTRLNIIRMMLQNHAIMAIWISNFDTPFPSPFWHVVCDEVKPIEEINKKTRNTIKKAARQFDIRLVHKSYIASTCYQIYKKSCTRYSQRPLTKNQFSAEINNKADNKYNFLVIFNRDDNQPIGYCYNKCYNNICYYILEKIAPEYLHIGASYYSNYYQNCYYLNDKGVRYIDAGARSIVHATNVQEFLISKFNYRKAYCDLNIEYLPLIKYAILLLHKLLNVYGKGNQITKNINSIFMYYEFAEYAKNPEYIYMLNNNKNFDEQYFNKHQLRIEVYKPKLQQLSREKLSLKRILLHLSWYIHAKGRYTIAYVIKDNKIIHYSYYIGKYYRFKYMKDNDISMGPAWTDPKYRGLGIYANVINYMKSKYYNDSLMLTVVNRENESGKRGVEKAGFVFKAFGYATKFLHVIYEIANE